MAKSNSPNNRIANTQAAIQYRVYPVNHVDGSGEIRSVASERVFFEKWQLDTNGHIASSQSYNPNGHYTHAVYGTRQYAHQSKTDHTRENFSENVDGGHQHAIGNGHHQEIKDAHTNATDGSKIQASKRGRLSFSTQGSGHHYMEGDQSFTVANGGMHHSVGSHYSVTTKDGVIHLDASEFSMRSNNGGMTSRGKFSLDAKDAISHNTGSTHTTTAKKDISTSTEAKHNMTASSDITITSSSKITLKVGGSSIEITSSGIKINSSGPIEIKGSQTKVQGGGVSVPPFTST